MTLASLPQLPQDKANHLIYGLLMFMVMTPFTGALLAVLTVAIIGALKEIIHDKLMGKGTPDFWDFVATAAGGALGFICTFL